MFDVKLEILKLGDDEAVKFLFETRSHPSVCATLIGRPPPDLATHRAWLEANVPNKRMVCLLKQGDKYLGYCHAYNYNADNTTLEAGFVIHPDYQNRGYGKLMVAAFMIVLSMSHTGWTVVLKVKENNHAAVKIYSQHGFNQTSYDNGVLTMERKL